MINIFRNIVDLRKIWVTIQIGKLKYLREQFGLTQKEYDFMKVKGDGKERIIYLKIIKT